MKVVPYAFVMGSMMYAPVGTHNGIAFLVSVFCRYLSDFSQSH